MEDKIEYKSKTGHFWIGLRNGSDFPLNRNVYAMARSQEYRPGLRNGSIFTEFFVAKNPEIVRCSCHSMESVVKKLHFSDGTTPGLMPATWVEFMGIGEKPEPATIVVDAGNDDYRIALDLDAGNCYYQFRDLDEATGAIWFLSQYSRKMPFCCSFDGFHHQMLHRRQHKISQ